MSIDRSVPDVHLHIGDERRREGAGGVHQHVFPATGEVQGPVPLAGPGDVDDAVAAAARRSRPGGRGHRGSAATCWSGWPSCSTRSRDELARLVGARQRHDARHRAVHRQLGRRLRPLLRRMGRQDRGTGDVVAGARPRARLHGARAVRRRRDHHHVERAAGVGRNEGHPGARRGQHRRDQAVGTDALRHRALHGSGPRGRHPRRRREHGAGHGGGR